MIDHLGEGKDHTLTLTGQSHELRAMPVGGEKWVGMISVKSPTDSALLQPHEAYALREWLTERLVALVDVSRPEHDDAECEQAFEDDYFLDLCPVCYRALVVPVTA